MALKRMKSRKSVGPDDEPVSRRQSSEVSD